MSDPFDVLEQGLAGPMERLRSLKFTGAPAGAAAFCQVRPDLAHATTPLSGYPFTLGVASGDPATHGAVLWTRHAPEVYEPDGGVPHRRLPVPWRVAKPAMRRVVRKGITLLRSRRTATSRSTGPTTARRSTPTRTSSSATATGGSGARTCAWAAP
jgi:phosphodiesterase/alkaline phosphatase D-like protein